MRNLSNESQRHLNSATAAAAAVAAAAVAAQAIAHRTSNVVSNNPTNHNQSLSNDQTKLMMKMTNERTPNFLISSNHNQPHPYLHQPHLHNQGQPDFTYSTKNQIHDLEPTIPYHPHSNSSPTTTSSSSSMYKFAQQYTHYDVQTNNNNNQSNYQVNYPNFSYSKNDSNQFIQKNHWKYNFSNLIQPKLSFNPYGIYSHDLENLKNEEESSLNLFHPTVHEYSTTTNNSNSNQSFYGIQQQSGGKLFTNSFYDLQNHENLTTIQNNDIHQKININNTTTATTNNNNEDNNDINGMKLIQSNDELSLDYFNLTNELKINPTTHSNFTNYSTYNKLNQFLNKSDSYQNINKDNHQSSSTPSWTKTWYSVAVAVSAQNPINYTNFCLKNNSLNHSDYLLNSFGMDQTHRIENYSSNKMNEQLDLGTNHQPMCIDTNDNNNDLMKNTILKNNFYSKLNCSHLKSTDYSYWSLFKKQDLMKNKYFEYEKSSSSLSLLDFREDQNLIKDSYEVENIGMKPNEEFNQNMNNNNNHVEEKQAKKQEYNDNHDEENNAKLGTNESKQSGLKMQVQLTNKQFLLNESKIYETIHNRPNPKAGIDFIVQNFESKSNYDDNKMES